MVVRREKDVKIAVALSAIVLKKWKYILLKTSISMLITVEKCNQSLWKWSIMGKNYEFGWTEQNK